MRLRVLLVAALGLGLAACDAAPSATAAAPAATRPEGWKSLDDEAAATRLYYQFVDARGQVRFVESLEQVPEALRAGVGYVRMSVPPPLTPGDAQRARAKQSEGVVAAVRASRAVLYSADWCGACTRAKRYLAEKGVAYEERNVDDPRYAEELFRKTGERGVPVIEVGGRLLTGFSAQLYEELLGRA